MTLCRSPASNHRVTQSYPVRGSKEGNIALSTKEKSRTLKAEYTGMANTLLLC